MMDSYSENISTSLENSRNCLRRIARNDDTEFSQHSILNTIEKFVKTVNAMNDTILVPCRLMDLKVGDKSDPTTLEHQSNRKKKTPSVKEVLSSADLFQVYNMLNRTKGDLVWGLDCDKEESTTSTLSLADNKHAVHDHLPVVKGHVRRSSTVSVTSTHSSSSAISDSDSDASVETDSGIEEHQEDNCDLRTEQAARNFRKHLMGLSESLRQMTDAAQYLIQRYQHDIGGSV